MDVNSRLPIEEINGRFQHWEYTWRQLCILASRNLIKIDGDQVILADGTVLTSRVKIVEWRKTVVLDKPIPEEILLKMEDLIREMQ